MVLVIVAVLVLALEAVIVAVSDAVMDRVIVADSERDELIEAAVKEDVGVATAVKDAVTVADAEAVNAAEARMDELALRTTVPELFFLSSVGAAVTLAVGVVVAESSPSTATLSRVASTSKRRGEAMKRQR